jgi:hypothetical protein
MVESNIHFNLDKSGWIKKQGKWIKPLKFLGLIYDGVCQNTLTSQTRRGNTLLFDKSALLAEVQAREITLVQSPLPEKSQAKVSKEEPKETGRKWLDFVYSSIAGFIQSRLYCGSWNLDEFEQDFELKYVTSSWVDKYGTQEKTPLTVFNSSSFASYSLCRILSRPSSKHRRWTRGPLFTPLVRT